jgi:DNA-binding CsgD family transcriptional regulator
MARTTEPTIADAIDPRPSWRDHFETVFASYVAWRALSAHQQRILRLYLRGANDKEIADHCACSEATVYEHWHRMARKAGGMHKSDVISDFHRFLKGTESAVEPV